MERNGIHIIDLHKTVAKVDEAAEALKQIAKSGKKILFVATKKQAKDVVAEKAASVNMPYVIERWFVQLIQNGFGPYIFDNPFAKAMRQFGAKEFAKLIYSAKKIYDENRADLEKDRDDEEFMAMYEQYEAFDELEEQFMDMEESVTARIAEYVDNHIEEFAEIV